MPLATVNRRESKYKAQSVSLSNYTKYTAQLVGEGIASKLSMELIKLLGVNHSFW